MRKRMIWVWAFTCGISLYTVVQYSTATTWKESSATIKTRGTFRGEGQGNSVRNTGTLSIEAGVIFQSGDVKPVARKEFVLSTKSLISVLREIESPPSEEIRPDESDRKLLIGFTAELWAMGFDPKQEAKYLKQLEALKKNVLASATTDFSGKATFSPLAPGTYYLIGWATFGKNYIVWDVKVELHPGPNTLLLDQNSGASFTW